MAAYFKHKTADHPHPTRGAFNRRIAQGLEPDPLHHPDVEDARQAFLAAKQGARLGMAHGDLKALAGAYRAAVEKVLADDRAGLLAIRRDALAQLKALPEDQAGAFAVPAVLAHGEPFLADMEAEIGGTV